MCFRFDRKIFCVAIQSACASRKRRSETPRQIRYVGYYEWALEITKIQQEDTFKQYSYLEEVLNYIRALIPNDVKAEVLEDWYKVSLKELCEALQNKLGVSLGLVFEGLLEKVYSKN